MLTIPGGKRSRERVFACPRAFLCVLMCECAYVRARMGAYYIPSHTATSHEHIKKKKKGGGGGGGGGGRKKKDTTHL